MTLPNTMRATALIGVAATSVACQSHVPNEAQHYRVTAQISLGQGNSVDHLEWSEDGSQLLLYGMDHLLESVTFKTGRTTTAIHSLSDEGLLADSHIVTAHWTSRGNIFAAFSNGSVGIWSSDFSTRYLNHHFSNINQHTGTMAIIDPEAKLIAYNEKVYDRESDTAQSKAALASDYPVGFWKGDYVTTLPWTNTVTLWNLHSGNQQTWHIMGAAPVISRDGSMLAIASGGYPGVLHHLFGSGTTNTLIQLYTKPSDKPVSVSTKIDSAMRFSPDARWLAGIENGQRLRIYQTHPLKLWLKTGEVTYNIDHFALSNALIIAWSDDGVLTVWNLKTKKLIGQLSVKHAVSTAGRITDVAINPDQQRLAVSFQSGGLQFLKLTD